MLGIDHCLPSNANFCKWVKYSSINSRKCICVISDVTLHANRTLLTRGGFMRAGRPHSPPPSPSHKKRKKTVTQKKRKKRWCSDSLLLCTLLFCWTVHSVISIISCRPRVSRTEMEMAVVYLTKTYSMNFHYSFCAMFVWLDLYWKDNNELL